MPSKFSNVLGMKCVILIEIEVDTKLLNYEQTQRSLDIPKEILTTFNGDSDLPRKLITFLPGDESRIYGSDSETKAQSCLSSRRAKTKKKIETYAVDNTEKWFKNISRIKQNT